MAGKKWKKIGYKFNPILDSIEQPTIILANRRLEKIGALTNVQDFRYTLKEYNEANEISFTYYKYVENEEAPLYDMLEDLSIIYVNDEYFEVSISNHEDSSIVKNVTGISLGHAELSQVITTLQVNTDDDLDRLSEEYPDAIKDGYVATRFYRPIDSNDSDELKKLKKRTSLLDRVISETPHYVIGNVDETLIYMQREFSWSDTDVLSILNAIGEEIGCVFEIIVTRDENGNAIRKINAYDLAYCNTCWDEVKNGNTGTASSSNEQDEDNVSKYNTSGDRYRNIVNGVCQYCQKKGRTASNIHYIGENTNVMLSTADMLNEITVDSNKDEIKTSFKITGGDDIMTDAVEGLNPSAKNRVMIIPDYMQKNMSRSLYNSYHNYMNTYNEKLPIYERLLTDMYNLYDIRQYLRSGKMPISDEPITTVEDALYDMFSNYDRYFEQKFYITKSEDFSNYAAKASIRDGLKIYLPEGFMVDVEIFGSPYNQGRLPGDYHPYSKEDVDRNTDFFGNIKIRKTSDSEDCISFIRDVYEGQIVTSIKKGANQETEYTYPDSDKQNLIINYCPEFFFADKAANKTEFAKFIDAWSAVQLSENDIKYDNEQLRDWSKYCLERLKNFYDGYTTCIDDMYSQLSPTSEWISDFAKETVDEIIEKYSMFKRDIEKQMSVLEEQIYAVCQCLGGFDLDSYRDSEGNILPIKWKNFGDGWSEALNALITPDNDSLHPGYTNGANDEPVFTPGVRIGFYPCKCRVCGSTNVKQTSEGVPYCAVPGCGASGREKIYTYNDLAINVNETATKMITGDADYSPYMARGKNINGIRTTMQEVLDIKNTLIDEEYDELMSYIREQVYSNSNYVGEGLTNLELVEKAKELRNKAIRELSKACMPQYTISMQIGSIVAQKPYEYNGETYNEEYANFAINNYIRAKIDDDIYKMRISSIELTYPPTEQVSVTFTNAERYVGGETSDVAEILANAQSMATSFSYVASQSESGKVAFDEFETIKADGLNTALAAIKAGTNQDVVMDQHGVLFRKYNPFTDEYEPQQMKMVNNSIMMTRDGWKTASLAIGLMKDPNSQTTSYLYGVIADAIIGDLVITKELRVRNEDNSVIINENGITLTGGKITWASPNSLAIPMNGVTNLNSTVNQINTDISDLNSDVSTLNTDVGKLKTFETNLKNALHFQTTTITENSVIAPYIGGGYLHITGGLNDVVIDPGNKQGLSGADTVISVKHNTATVFKVDTSGNLKIKGEVDATSGSIGNGTTKWTIGSSSNTRSYIYNGAITDIATVPTSDSGNGIYVGTDGILNYNGPTYTRIRNGTIETNAGIVANLTGNVTGNVTGQITPTGGAISGSGTPATNLAVPGYQIYNYLHDVFGKYTSNDSNNATVYHNTDAYPYTFNFSTTGLWIVSISIKYKSYNDNSNHSADTTGRRYMSLNVNGTEIADSVANQASVQSTISQTRTIILNVTSTSDEYKLHAWQDSGKSANIYWKINCVRLGDNRS